MITHPPAPISNVRRAVDCADYSPLGCMRAARDPHFKPVRCDPACRGYRHCCNAMPDLQPSFGPISDYARHVCFIDMITGLAYETYFSASEAGWGYGTDAQAIVKMCRRWTCPPETFTLVRFADEVSNQQKLVTSSTLPIIVTDKRGRLLYIFRTRKLAAGVLGCNVKTIANAADTGKCVNGAYYYRLLVPGAFNRYIMRDDPVIFEGTVGAPQIGLSRKPAAEEVERARIEAERAAPPSPETEEP